MKKTVLLILIISVLRSCFFPLCVYASENLSDIDINWQIYFEDIETNFNKYQNVHPRIWLDNSDFVRIKGYGQNEYKDLLMLIENSADKYTLRGPKEYVEDEENVWMNTQGKELVSLIFAYKITQKEEYINAIFSYIDKICTYPSWSNKATEDNCHLAGNSNFLAFGIAYDWLYNDLGEKRKEKIVNNIKTRIEDFNYDSSYGFDSVNLHNMIVINTSALVALSAMYEEIPKAEEYIKRISAKLATLTLPVMPDDGAAFEAVNYSSYTWLGLLQAGMVMRDLLNVDILSHPTFDAYTKFSVYSYLPVNGWKSSDDDVFGWGDGTEDSNGNLLPVMSFMANKKKNGVYKYFVEKRIEYAISKNATSYTFMYPLMFADVTLDAISPAEDSSFSENYVTKDTGYVFLKNNWSGDEASIHFHSGPILGNTASEFRKIYKGNTLGAGHNHPDMGSPLIFAEGEWLFEDDNYVTGVTSNHNTLTINGIGQLADNALRRIDTDYINPGTGKKFTAWQAMVYAKPEIIKNQDYTDMTYVVCDLTDIYPDEHYGSYNTELNKYLRHFIYLKKEKALLVTDEIVTERNKNFELRWHPVSQDATKQPDGSYVYKGKNSAMRLEPFPSYGTEITNSIVSVVSGKDGQTKDSLVMQIRNKGTQWIQSTAISWENNTLGKPLNFSYTKKDRKCVFEYDGNSITLDLDLLSLETDEKVYYYNDFSDPETDSRYYQNNYNGIGLSDGTFKLYRGSTVILSDDKVSSFEETGILIKESEKPDIKVEYEITVPAEGIAGGFAAKHSTGPRYIVSSGIRKTPTLDAVSITTQNVWAASHTVNAYEVNSLPLYKEDDLKGKTFKIKILYSGSENVRTVYVNDVCYGTFENKSSYSWADDSDNKFMFGFTSYGQHSSENSNPSSNQFTKDSFAYIFDDIKISKLNSEMITVPVSRAEKIAMPTGSSDKLWIPSGECPAVNIQLSQGDYGKLLINNRVYADSFTNDFTCVLPELKQGDRITLVLKNYPYSYTSPYYYRYERYPGMKSTVIFGGFNDDTDGFIPYAYGIYYSFSDETVTIGNSGVYKLDIKNRNIAVCGNFGIDLYGTALKENVDFYYRVYADYLNEETGEIVNCCGEIRSFTVE